MNRRGKRLTLGVMAVGLAVILILTIAYRRAILEHIEAWHFQLTRKTETVMPNAAWPERINDGEPTFWLVDTGNLAGYLANCSGKPVIVDPESWDSSHSLVSQKEFWAADDFTTEYVLQLFRNRGVRIFEQRFPRRAYVVILDKNAAKAEFPKHVVD